MVPYIGSGNVFVVKYFAKVMSKMFSSVHLVVVCLVADGAGVQSGAVLVNVELAHIYAFN